MGKYWEQSDYVLALRCNKYIKNSLNELGMNTDKLSGIVVYTIYDNDDLRNALCNALKDNMRAEYLDDSTYGIAIRGQLTKDILESLKNICKKAEETTKTRFGNKDFVVLYRIAYPNETGDECCIKRTRII